MYHQGMCGGGYCYGGKWSKKDELAMLEEHEKILEAKLATIRHMKESMQASKEDSN